MEEEENEEGNIIMENLAKEMAETKVRVTIMESEVSTLKTSTALNKQLTDTILGMLTKIEGSIDKIAQKMNVIEGKSGQRWEQIIKTLITVTITAGAMYLIKK